MPFAVAAAGITAGAGLIGASMQRSAVKAGQDQAQQRYTQSRNDLLPWQEGGQPAIKQQQDLLGLNGPEAADAAMGTFRSSPGYQWQLEQGIKALDQSASANHLLRSGALMTAVQNYGQGLADQDFGSYFTRLVGLSEQGLGAAKAIAGVGSDSARSAQVAGAMDASIYGNAAQGIGNTANSLLNDKGFREWWNTPAAPAHYGEALGPIATVNY